MIPYMKKGDLNKLPKTRQRKVCGCNDPCQTFITFSHNSDFLLCEQDAKEFAFEILAELGVLTKKLAFPKSKYGWTTEQEQFVIRYLKDEHCLQNGRVKYGTYSILGEMLGKSREQVKNKIQHMKKEKKLT